MAGGSTVHQGTVTLLTIRPHSRCHLLQEAFPASPCLSWPPQPSLVMSPSGRNAAGAPGGGARDLLQGIFPTQGSNPDLRHCRRILYSLSHQGSPRILECAEPTASPVRQNIQFLGLRLSTMEAQRALNVLFAFMLLGFSRGSSQPRYQMWVSHIAGKFFTI